MADVMTPAQRSALMARIRGVDTKPERVLRSELHRRGLRFFKHVKTLPGRPDIVFPRAMVVVFVDGDFWHGYQFHRWKAKLTPFWQEKIEGNRIRDRRNFRWLRTNGWTVIRIWEHEIKLDVTACADRVCCATKDR
ncbi:very short patch repair endonuclease [Pseudoxanthomonas helianthi]|uniref:Very short patch repair endonuclease n=1 Tax=Pseudoxanthomonas helianthi TaxID=1453541 RepID=A0A941AT67_9GAMM|nr:very short patch repair endonuclease [Pseudoxanthomonas helianthi]MBP3983597.1 very short patch repair endonuclease [Pseudoxanthomonas helianthi]